MGFAPAGISKLSQLGIDVDKDWAAHLINNLGAGVALTDAIQLQQAILQALLTTQGDIIFRNATAADRLAGAPVISVPVDTTTGDSFLHYNGNTGAPEWVNIAALVGKWFITIARKAIPAPPTNVQVTQTAAAGGVTGTVGPTVPSLPSESTGTTFSAGNAVTGFIEHQQTGPTDIDQTAAANNATANDMTVVPNPIGAIGDGCYFGYATPWDWLLVNVGTAKVGTLSIIWKYWNGTSFVALTMTYDEITSWSSTGKHRIQFTRPGDWASSTIAGITAYWIKGEVQAGYALTTYPLGTQAWIGQY